LARANTCSFSALLLASAVSDAAIGPSAGVDLFS